jgi:hypothetical protein
MDRFTVFSRALAAGVVMLSASWLPAQETAKPADAAAAAPKPPSKFEAAIKDAKKTDLNGLWTVYYKDQQILVELKSSQLSQDFLMLTSIARGVSSGMVIGGMSWGDDVIWNFRKVGDKMHLLRKNVRFKAKPGSPEATAVKFAYSDSVLYALPIVTDSPGGHLVDMTRVFFSDDEQIGRAIGGSFAMDRSTVAKVKSFPKNVELQIAAVYQAPSGGFLGGAPMDTVPDPRGMQVQVHYSISLLPSTGYKPRKADDRVGYFLAVSKDFTDNSDDQHFVRQITRWDLQKLDSAAKLSPPKEPIIFYLEKTIPISLRPIVQSGIEEWNQAFEKIGFANAIDVRQQREDDDWDPEDVRYNTFRWITAEAGFAMGPSRVNPMTGQILDADIIFDASFLRYWKQEYENFSPQTIAELIGDDTASPADTLPLSAKSRHGACNLSVGMQHQMGFAAAAMLAHGVLDKRGELPEEFLQQALKEVVMHEVGHTLGLRHNFKASSWKTLAEIEDANRSATEPLVASVMDYHPVNLTPAGVKQTAYYTTTIGPYDYWAIEYGYKPISGDENAELAKIASKSGEPGLDYATDEDTEFNDPDPLSNRFDLGKDPVAYSQRQMKTVAELLPKILEKAVDNGEGYQRVRRAFGLLQNEYLRSANFVSRLPGGVLVHRDHKGDSQGRPPFKIIDAAQQRAATKLITEQCFSAPKFDPVLLNSLAASRWDHWGMSEPDRVDFPIHDVVNQSQRTVLNRLLDARTLARIQDGEVKVSGDDAYTLAEHLRLITEGVFSELENPAAGDYTNRNQFVPSFRRNLQRNAMRKLAGLLTPSGSTLTINSRTGRLSIREDESPDDARNLARMHLSNLQTRIAAALNKGDLKLDDYSRAHLLDMQEKVKQALSAQLTVNSIN